MRQLFQAGQLFQGVVSNCNQSVESTTSGKITTTAFTRSVKGSIDTTHHHYTTFDIGNMSFVLEGNYPIRDGDEVVCYAIKIGGHYLVETLKMLQGIILLVIDLVLYGGIILDLYLGFCLLVWQLLLLFL